MKKLLFKDVIKTLSVENNEPFTNGDQYSTNIYLADVQSDQDNPDPFNIKLDIRRPPEFPNSIYLVRTEVAKRLANAANNLNTQDSRLKLVLAYGYRALEIQQEIFDRVIQQKRNELPTSTSEIDILEAVNQIIASPSVAGHPTGGAVDVAIWKWTQEQSEGEYLDMGYPLLDLDGDEIQMSYYANNLTNEQVQNRKLLTDTMVDAGFAPFWGEWWHFSYGDREWATYYSTSDKPLQGIYTPRSLKDAKELFIQKPN